MRRVEATFYADLWKLINNFMSTSNTQRYSLSVKCLRQKPNHQGKGRNIVDLVEHESRAVILNEISENGIN